MAPPHEMHAIATHADRPLLQRIAAGDASAVREVIDHYGDLVWSLARTFTRSDTDAEEAVQDIFVLLWRKADQYDPGVGPEATFISVLARRLLIDRWRRDARHPRPASFDAVGERAALDHASDFGDWTDAAAAFEALDEDSQVVLRLSIGFGFTHQMVADATGLPLGTVKTRIRRGLRQIRENVGIRTATRGAKS